MLFTASWSHFEKWANKNGSSSKTCQLTNHVFGVPEENKNAFMKSVYTQFQKLKAEKQKNQDKGVSMFIVFQQKTIYTVLHISKHPHHSSKHLCPKKKSSLRPYNLTERWILTDSGFPDSEISSNSVSLLRPRSSWVNPGLKSSGRDWKIGQQIRGMWDVDGHPQVVVFRPGFFS